MAGMNSAAPLRAATRAARGRGLNGEPAGAAARLALVEDLSRSGSKPAAADLALSWLRAQGHVEHGLCAVTRAAESRLVGIAGARVAKHEVDGFSVSLLDKRDPFIVGLGAGAPLLIGAEGARQRCPKALRGRRHHVYAIPIRREVDSDAQGLLLVAVRPQLTPGAEVSWAAGQLAAAFLMIDAARLSDVERARDQERDHWRDIIEAVTDPILLTDGEGRILVANEQAEKLFVAHDSHSEGRRRAVALNNMLFSAASFTAMDAASAPRELLLVDPIEGKDLVFELLRTTTRPTSDDAGVVSILRNITDLRSASEALEDHVRKLRGAEAEVRAERDRLNLILQSVADPVLVTDPAGNVTLLNPPAERFFALDEGAAETAQRRARANDAVFTSFLSNLYTERAGRWRGEINLVDVNTDEVVRVEATAGKVLAKSGELAAVVTTLHDKTEELEKERLYEQVRRHSVELADKVREATAELASQNELLRRQAIALEQASQLKSQFLANMSHELRTPLTAILGYTQLLLKSPDEELAASHRKKLTRLDANARHLLAIINDLLDIARIESGKMPLHTERFAVDELVSDVMTELEPLVPRETVTVEVAVQAALPTLETDRQKVKQILVNLVSNAFKFTPAGSVRVEARRAEGFDGVIVDVADTGIGIREEDRERIFEDFRQADGSDTRKYKGTGLGLAISRRLAEMLGGGISVDSEVGRGSVFTLVVPRRVEAT